MAYKVSVSPLARADILQTADYIRDKGYADRAATWKRELLRAIKMLDEMSNRCAVADEASDLKVEVRQLLYHSHRIVFRVIEDTQTVEVLRVYHSSRAPLSLEDLTS